PANGTTSGVPVAMSTARTKLSATTLLDGHVLIAGGRNGAQDLASAEIYDAKAQALTATRSMALPRSGHLAILLPDNNNVLIAGGSSSGRALDTAELYAHWQQTFSFAPNPMLAARVGAIGGGLKRYDAALVAGGGALTGEYYGFATVKTDKDDYWPGDVVTITGTGWQPGETVTLQISEDADTHEDFTFTALADSAGNIVNSGFSPVDNNTDHDLGIRFYVNATGVASQAQNTFADGATLDGFKNKPPTDWGGTLQSSNSIYRENDLIPTRYQLAGLSANAVYTVI